MVLMMSIAPALPSSPTLASSASAVPGTPGTPQAPTLVFEETFENNVGAGSVLLTSYTGPTGQTYTADPAWLTNCNGNILQFNLTGSIPNCPTGGEQAPEHLRSLSYALGVQTGSATPATNHGLGGYTDNGSTGVDPGSNKTVVQTVQPIPLPSGLSKRFIIFTVDAAAINCGASHPQYQFFLTNGAASTAIGGQIDTCTAAGGTNVNVPFPPGGTLAARIGRYPTTALAFTGASLGLRMINNDGGGGGNDGAIDNLRILDVTPQLDKAFSPTSLVAGATSTLTFTITNTTDLAAKNGWSFTDALPAGLTLTTPAATTTCSGAVISAPNNGTTVSASGNLNQGQASCTVTVSVTAPAGTYTNGPGNVTASGLNPPGPATVVFRQPVTLSVAKTGSSPTYQPGGPFTYTVAVTNSGPGIAAGVAVSDPLPASLAGFTWTCAGTPGSTCAATGTGDITDIVTIAVGGTVTYTVSGTVPLNTTGSLVNTATVTPPTTLIDAGCTPSCSSTVTTLEPAPTMLLTKNVAGRIDPADQFTVTLQDSGSATVTSATTTGTSTTVSSPRVPVVRGATYTITDAMAAGSPTLLAGFTPTIACTNNSTGAALAPGGSAPTWTVTIPDPHNYTCIVTNTALEPELTLEKSVTPQTVAAAGDQVTYSFLVTNTGDATITGISIAETAFSGTGTAPAVSCPPGAASLAPGASVTCTATYNVTQQDVDAGLVTNEATASGTPPGGGTTTSLPSDAQVTAAPAPSVLLIKSGSPADAASFTDGQVITYSFVVTNTGNVTLTGVSVAETAFSGTGGSPAISCPGGAPSLAPGDSVTCTATYTITAQDVDSGLLTNSAVATGNPPTGGPVTSSSDFSIPGDPNPSLTLAKSASPTVISAVGEQVTYSFLVTNTGNVTLTGVSVAETAFSGSGGSPTVSCPAGAASLAAGTSVTCSATYASTQEDLDAGEITNEATASGTDPFGSGVTSDPSEATVTVTQSPELTLVKSALPTSITIVGESVAYSFLVTNSGNVTLTGVSVVETAFSGSGGSPAISCPVEAASLAPGAAVTCIATYSATQEDLDAGVITNEATASGTDTDGASQTSNLSAAMVTVSQSPGLSLVKSATPTAVSSVGEQVTYSFLVTNSGNVTLTGISVAETAFSGTGGFPAIICPPEASSLAPGSSVSCTATYAATQEDVDAGIITNEATASGTDPNGVSLTTPPSAAVVTVSQSPGLSLVKSATPTTISTVGEQVTYSFLVTNSGNVTLTGISVTEAAFSGTGGPPAITCPPEAVSLAPGASVTCTATYSATQEDLDAGQITNEATASGTDPNGASLTTPPSAAVVTVSQLPGLSLVKSASPTTVSTVGEQVTYNFLVTNSGNVTLTGISVTEAAFSGTGGPPAITCPPEAVSLAPGASVTCTATYSATQEDLDAGQVTNEATASGTDPNGVSLTTPPSAAVVTVSQSPGLTLMKSASPTSISMVGDQVTYAFLVANSGNVTLTGISIAETAFSGTGGSPAITCPPEAASLAPGASVTCTASYSATQADLDSGQVLNSATASGSDPNGVQLTTPPSSAIVTVDLGPGLSLAKSASPTSISAVGEQVAYSFLVTNTGNVTLTGVSVAETAFSGTGGSPMITCPVEAASLAPGASVTCSATYLATQADLDAGQITNEATASGSDPIGGSLTTPPSSAIVTVDQGPALTLLKSASPDDPESFTVGQVITYSFLVTNSGNVTITDVSVAEQSFTGSAAMGPISCPAEAASLASGASVTCTANYLLTQADVDARSVTNVATASGLDPDGNPVPSGPSSVTIPGDPAPALELVKSADPVTVAAAGDSITYSFLVTNVGNVTLAGISIAETAFSGTGAAPMVSCPAEAVSLAPGASVTCTADYMATQADVDAGAVTNEATASGNTSDGTTVVSPPSTAQVTAPEAPDLTLVKSALPVTIATAGDLVTYQFLATNSGNVTLTDLAISETDFSGTGSAPVVTCPDVARSLVPGAQVVCSATYRATQADVDTGILTNIATATGVPPSGEPVTSNPSTAEVTVSAAPQLTLVKSVSGNSVFAVGETVIYRFVVTNSGNVTVTGVSVAEAQFTGTGSAPAITCPAGTPLAPGEHVVCTADYVLTQSDVTAGQVDNTAVATGMPVGSTTPVSSPPSSVTIPAAANPSIAMVKGADLPSITAAGQEVTFTFVVTNTGDVDLTDVAIRDSGFTGSGQLSQIDCPSAAALVAPGASITCTATYTTTDQDLAAGSLSNTATATGTPPGSTPVSSPPSTVAVPVSMLALAKTAVPVTGTGTGNAPGTVGLGDRVQWRLTVRNVGRTEVSGIVISDPTAGAVHCPTTVLAVDESMVCSAPDRVIGQDDVVAGVVRNAAVATGNGLGQVEVQPQQATAAVSVGPDGAQPPIIPPVVPPIAPPLANTGVRYLAEVLTVGIGLLTMGALLILGSRRSRRRP